MDIQMENGKILYAHRLELIKKNIMRDKHKHQYFESLSTDLYKTVHKRKYYRSIDAEILQIAWHPNRAVDWCFDEEEKRDLRRLWGEL